MQDIESRNEDEVHDDKKAFLGSETADQNEEFRDEDLKDKDQQGRTPWNCRISHTGKAIQF